MIRKEKKRKATIELGGTKSDDATPEVESKSKDERQKLCQWKPLIADEETSAGADMK